MRGAASGLHQMEKQGWTWQYQLQVHSTGAKVEAR